jgi:hypothetical protein
MFDKFECFVRVNRREVKKKVCANETMKRRRFSTAAHVPPSQEMTEITDFMTFL